MKNQTVKKSLIWFLLGISIPINLGFLLYSPKSDSPAIQPEATGRIIVRLDGAGEKDKNTFYMLDGEGRGLFSLGNYTGSPTWSPDGKYFALGCESPTELCIRENITFDEQRNFPKEMLASTPVKKTWMKKLNLPEACKAAIKDDPDSHGLESISWSVDQKSFLVLCGSSQPEVCVVSEEKESYCWDKGKIKDIQSAVWSPAEDIIAVSGGEMDKEKIYLTDPKTMSITYITDGRSPEWSRDGKEMIFIRPVNDPLYSEDARGIAIMNKAGSNLRWLYLPPKKQSLNLDNDIFFTCEGLSMDCRLAWSPDKRYIAFTGRLWSIYGYHMFRLDTVTGKVVFMDISLGANKRLAEPTWGP